MTEKVLVTGATGFVGANLVRRLLQRDYDVHIITRASSNKWRLADILSKLSDYTVDLSQPRKLRTLIRQVKPDVIFHLAASGIYSGVQLSERKLIEINFSGTVNLVNACQDIDYKCFVNTGSSSEYGPKRHPMKETDVCEPITMYGITKCAATLYGGSIAKTKDKPIIGFRLFSPYGPYDDKSRLVVYSIVNALQNKDLNLANPEAVRDYIYVEDVVDLYMRSIDRAYELKGEVFNAGSGSQTTISSIVSKVIEFTQSKSNVNWQAVKGRGWDTQRWEADIEKTSKTFNWKPTYDIEKGLKRTIDWFRNNLSFYHELP
jgi:nucleoside-diphosphate-sugar epimerase